MKSIIKLIVLAFVILCMGSCSTDITEYEGETGIYFVMQVPPLSNYGNPETFEYVDTTRIDFASLTRDDTTVRIRVRILGDISDRDRSFSMKIDEKGTTAKAGEDYDAFELNPCISAGASQVDVPCRIVKTDKLYQHPDTVIYLAFELQPNADFVLPFSGWLPFGNIYGDSKKTVSVTHHVVALSNVISRPEIWFDMYWGTFSVKKFTVMSALFHMALADFNKMSLVRDRTKALIMGQNLDKYLKEKEKDGKTIYEDVPDKNGDLVKMKAGTSI